MSFLEYINLSGKAVDLAVFSASEISAGFCKDCLSKTFLYSF